jgi:hypothetical protein
VILNLKLSVNTIIMKSIKLFGIIAILSIFQGAIFKQKKSMHNVFQSVVIELTEVKQ